METRLTEEEIRIISTQIASKVIDFLKEYFYFEEDDDFKDEWLSAEEAAKYLRISRSRLYQIKNYLTHIKGKSVAGRLYFKKSRLLDDYMNI